MLQEHLRQLADGLVLSKIRYGLSVYGGAIRTSDDAPFDGMIHPLEIAVNNVMRIIERVGLKDHVPIHELRSKTNIPSVNQMTAQAVLTESWKIVHGESSGLDGMLVELDESGIKTRAKANKDMKVPFGSQLFQKSFAHQGAALWNALPNDIRQNENARSAKTKIREHIRSQFP